MKNEFNRTQIFAAGAVMLAIIFAPVFLGSAAWADETNDTVAGCQAVAVDPNSSFEYQQAICRAAEQNPGSSCAAGGHGLCSSPKTDDTMVDGTNCICVTADVTDVPAE